MSNKTTLSSKSDDVIDNTIKVIGTLIVAIVVGIIATIAINGVWGSTLGCNTEVIEYEIEVVRYEGTSELNKKDYVTKPGRDGELQVCHDLFGTKTRTTTTKQPVAQEVVRYQYRAQQTPSYTPPVIVQPQGGGAICNDGTRSYSTGRGTCSWHGGVNYWL